MLTTLQSLADGQGPLFWGAAAAAALGASLLVAALMMQARRWRFRISLPRLARPSFRRFRRRGAPAPGLARAVPGGYAPVARPVLPPMAAAGTPAAAMGPDLGPALARLRRASDRLAELQEATAESRLKGTPGKVDLKARRGVG